MPRFKARIIVDGECDAEILFIDSKISFFGEVDPYKGIIRGKNVGLRGRALVFRGGRGSTVGSYIIYALKYYGNKPACIVVERAEPIIITGAVLGDIPLFEIYQFNDLREAILRGARRIIHRVGEEYVEAI